MVKTLVSTKVPTGYQCTQLRRDAHSWLPGDSEGDFHHPVDRCSGMCEHHWSMGMASENEPKQMGKFKFVQACEGLG